MATDVLIQATAALQALNEQRKQKTSVKESTSADKKLLSVSRYYGTSNEMLRDMFSGTKNYNEQMYGEAAQRGELSTYFALLELNKDNTMSDDYYDPLMYDYDTYMAELYRPEVDDTEKTLEERFTQEFDPATNSYKEVSIGKMTDRQYLDYTIEKNREYQRQDIEHQLQAYQKESMSGWEKFWNTTGQILAEFPVGIGEALVGLVDIFGALGYSTVTSIVEGKNFGDVFVDYYGDIGLTSQYKESVRAGLDEWERRYGWVKDIHGNNTSVGGALASISNSFGMMIPSIAIGALTGGATLPFTKIPVAFTSFYVSMFSGNMYENAINEALDKNPSWSLILNAALKSTGQAVIEWGLGKILGGTIGNSLLGLGSRGVLRGTERALSKGATALFVLKSAAQEGLEEFLQDMGDMLIDSVFAEFQDGYTKGVDLQQLMDSFIIGAASSLLLSAGSVSFQEAVSGITKGNNKFDIFYTKDGQTHKVRGFSRLLWRDMLNEYREGIELLKEGRLSQKKASQVLDGLMSTYQVLGQYFDGITPERIAKATELFNDYLDDSSENKDKIVIDELTEFAKEQFPGEEITPELLRTIYDEDVTYDEAEYAEVVNNVKDKLVTQLSDDIDTALMTSKIVGITEAKTKIKRAIKDNADKLAESETTHITRTIKKGETVGETGAPLVQKKREKAKAKAKAVDAEVEKIWQTSQETVDDLSKDYEWIFGTDGHVAFETGEYLFVPEAWLENYKPTQIREFLVQADVISTLTTDKAYKPIYEAMLKSYKKFTGADLRKGDIRGAARVVIDTLFNEAVFQNFLLDNIHNFVDKNGVNVLFTLANVINTLGKKYAKKYNNRNALLEKIYDKIKETMRRPILRTVINWNMDPQLSGATRILPKADVEFINQRKARDAVIKGSETSAYFHVRDEILAKYPQLPQGIKDIIAKGSQKSASNRDKLTARIILDTLDSYLYDENLLLCNSIYNLIGNIYVSFDYFNNPNSDKVEPLLLFKGYLDRAVEFVPELQKTNAYSEIIRRYNFLLERGLKKEGQSSEEYSTEEYSNIGRDMFVLAIDLLKQTGKNLFGKIDESKLRHNAESVFTIPVEAFSLENPAEISHYTDVVNQFKEYFGLTPELLAKFTFDIDVYEELRRIHPHHVIITAYEKLKSLGIDINDKVAVKKSVINWLEEHLGDGYVVLETEDGIRPSKTLTSNELFRPEILEGNLAKFVDTTGICFLDEILSDYAKELLPKELLNLQIHVFDKNNTEGSTTESDVTTFITLNSFDINALYHEVLHAIQHHFSLPTGGSTDLFLGNKELSAEVWTELRDCIKALLYISDYQIRYLNDVLDDEKISYAKLESLVKKSDNPAVEEEFNLINNAIAYTLYMGLEGELYANMYSHNERVNGYILSKNRDTLKSPLTGKIYKLSVTQERSDKKAFVPTTSKPSETYQVNNYVESFKREIQSHDDRYMNDDTTKNYHSAFTGDEQDLLDDLLNDSIGLYERSIVTIDQVIRHPEDYLKKSILKQIKDKSEGGMFRFLQIYFFKLGTGYNIDRHAKSHQYIFVDDNAFADIATPTMQEAMDNDDDYDFVQTYKNKTNHLSDFIDKAQLRKLNIPVDIPVEISTNRDVDNQTIFNSDNKNGRITLRVDNYTTNAELAMMIMHEFRHVLQHYNRLESGFTNDFSVSSELKADMKREYPDLFTDKEIRERFKTDERIIQQFIYFQVGGEQNAYAFVPDILVGKPWYVTNEGGRDFLFAPWYDGKNGVYETKRANRMADVEQKPTEQKSKTKVPTTEELNKRSLTKGKITYPAQVTSRKKQIEIMVADNWANVGLPELDDKLNIILDSKYSKRFRTTTLNEVLSEYRELLTMFYSYRLQAKNDVNITSQEDVDFQVNEEMTTFEEALKELITKSKGNKRSKSAYNKFRNLAGSIYMKVWNESYKTYSDNEIRLAYNEGVAKTKPDLHRGLTKDKLPTSNKRGQHKYVRRKETGKKDKAGNPETKPVYSKEGWYLNEARAKAIINGQTSNLQYFYHKGIQTQMRPELQDFIEATTGNEAKLPKAIVTAIKVGKLTYEQLITWFRKTDAADINDYTFDLINKHFFKNTKITDIQQLDTILTSDIKLWYAIPQALLREGASLEWLVQQNSLEGFMTFLEQADGTSFKKTIDAIIANMNFDRFEINLKEAQTYLRPMVMEHFDGTLGSAMYTAALYINYLSKDAKSRFGQTSLDKENKGGNKGAGKGGESGNQGTLSDMQKTKTKAEAEVDALVGEGASESDLVNALALAGKEVQDKAGKAARLARNEYEKTNRAKEINALFSAISNIKTLSKVSKEDRTILAKFLAKITANDTFNTEQQPYSKTDLLKVLKALIENPALLNKEGSAKALKILRTRIELRLEEVFMNEIDKNVEKKRTLAESGAIDIKEKIETQEGIEDAATDLESLAQESYDAIRTDFYRYLDKKQLTKTELERFQFLVEQMMYESYNLSYLAMPDEELQARSDMLKVADYAPESIREIIEEKVTEKSVARTNITNLQTRIKSFGTQIANMVERHQIDFSLLPKEVQDLFDVIEIGPKTNRDIRIKLKESAYKLNPQFNSTEQTDKQKARIESITRISDVKNLLQDVVTAAKQKAYLKNDMSKTIREIQRRAQRKATAQKRKFAQVEAGLRETVFEYKKKMTPTKNTSRQKNLAVKTDVTVSVGSKVELPEKLVTLFGTGFEGLADTEVQFASKDTDGKLYEKGDSDFESRLQHEVISWERFYDVNRETLRDLSRDDVLDIVDAIQQGIFAQGDLDAQRKVLAFQIFILGYIYDGTRGNQNGWNLSDAEIDSIRQTYEKLASVAGTGLNAVKQMISTVNPVKTIQQRLWEDWGIEPEQSEPIFQTIERLITAPTQEDYDHYSKQLAGLLGQVEALMKKHQLEMAAESRKAYKERMRKTKERWKADIEYYNYLHKEWQRKKDAGEDAGPEPQRPEKPRTLKEGFLQSKFYKDLTNWRYMSMLSSPATWARNLISNVLVKGVNSLSDRLGNLVFDIAKKGYREDQWDLSYRTKVSQEVDDYVNNLVKSITYVVDITDKNNNVIRQEERKLFDLLYDGTSKYSDRLRLKTGSDLFSALVTQAIESKYAATHKFNNAALNRVYNFVQNRIKDTRFIKSAANKYFKKILQLEIEAGRIDISKPISRDILDLFAEAVILASQDFMHKESAFFTIMTGLKEKHPKAYAALTIFAPFANASFNWFTEFLKLSPFGLVRAIYNSVHLEDYIFKIDSLRAEGRVLPSTKAVEYLTRRDVGKGILGTILWGVGALLAAIGVIRLDDEDDKQYIYFGENFKIDISDIFGSSSLLIGAALVNGFHDDQTFEDVLGMTMNLLLDGFIAKDWWEQGRYASNMYEFMLSYTESYLKSFWPQFIQVFVRATNNHNIQYSSGIYGALQRYLNAFVPTQPHGDYKVNPYTGELETKYAIPFLGELLKSGIFFVRAVWSDVSEGEQLAKEYGVNKGMINPEMTINGKKVSFGDKNQLNQYYGRLNAASLAEVQNKSHLVEMTDGSFKTLSWSQMNDIQRTNVIERIFTKNATYAKIYMWTQVQKHKYYTNKETRNVLKELGITSNVYLGDKGYVE